MLDDKEDLKKTIKTVIALLIEEGDLLISNLLVNYEVCRMETGTHIWKPNTYYYKLYIIVPKDEFDKIESRIPAINLNFKDKIEDHLVRKENEVFMGFEILRKQ